MIAQELSTADQLTVQLLSSAREARDVFIHDEALSTVMAERRVAEGGTMEALLCSEALTLQARIIRLHTRSNRRWIGGLASHHITACGESTDSYSGNRSLEYRTPVLLATDVEVADSLPLVEGWQVGVSMQGSRAVDYVWPENVLKFYQVGRELDHNAEVRLQPTYTIEVSQHPDHTEPPKLHLTSQEMTEYEAAVRKQRHDDFARQNPRLMKLYDASADNDFFRTRSGKIIHETQKLRDIYYAIQHEPIVLLDSQLRGPLELIRALRRELGDRKAQKMLK